jgi:hypothetical protein
MKTLFTAALLCTLFYTTNGQLKKGNIYLDGSFSLSNNSNANDGGSGAGSQYSVKSGGVNFHPTLGLLVSDRSVVGFGLGLSYYTSKTISNSQINSSKFYGLGTDFFYRRYVPLSEHIAFFINAAIGFDRGRTTQLYESGTSQSETKSKNFSISGGIGPGLTYFLNNKWALETNFAGLYLSKNWYKVENSSYKNNDFSAGLSLSGASLYFGFKYFINR